MIYFFFLQQKNKKTIGSSYTMSVLAGIVGPILNSIFHEKDLLMGNNYNFLFGKISLYDILSKQMHCYYYAIYVYLSTRYYTLQYLQCYSGASFSIGHGVVMAC